MIRHLVAALAVLALAACDDFDELACRRTGCDGGHDAGGGGAGGGGGTGGGTGGGIGGGTAGGTSGGTGGGTAGGASGGTGGGTAGGTSGGTGGGTAGGTSGGTGGGTAGGTSGGTGGGTAGGTSGGSGGGGPASLVFDRFFGADAGDDLAGLSDLAVGPDFVMLAPSNQSVLTRRLSTWTSSVFGAFRPTCLGVLDQLALMGRDNGLDTWNPEDGGTASLSSSPSPTFQVQGVSGFPGGAFLVGVNLSANNLAWNSPGLVPADAGTVRTVSCLTTSVTVTSVTNGAAHQVLGVGSSGGACPGFGNLFFGRWLPGDSSLSVAMTGHWAIGPAHAATENLNATFAWQEATGIQLARVSGSATSLTGAGEAVPLASSAAVATGLTVTNSEFVLVLVAPAAGQELRFTDGGVVALEPGVPIVLWGTWGAPPIITRVRALRLGHRVSSPVLGHSLTTPDEVYLGGLCQSSDAGAGVPPCDRPGPMFFVLHVQPV